MVSPTIKALNSGAPGLVANDLQNPVGAGDARRPRTVPYPLDRAVYRRRNLIERLFCRLKNWRRLATRYDRLARNYLAALALVAVVTEWT
jgi:transposase